jgi:UDP-N-acetylmuramoylalanine--D-glutamate ligase
VFGRKAVLILGGDGKGQNFAPLAPVVKDRARHVLLIGRDAPLIEQALRASGVPLESCPSLEDAVARAARVARMGDAVLLSPPARASTCSVTTSTAAKPSPPR